MHDVYSIRPHVQILTRAAIHLPNFSDHERINRIYDLLGPTPRLCINYLIDPPELARYEDDIRKALSSITLETLEKLFKDSSSLAMDDIPSKICLISRNNVEDMASLSIVKPITPSIQSRLAGQIRTLERREQIRLFKKFAKVPSSRGVAGVLFEAAAQLKLQDGMKLELIPMVRLSPTKKIPQPQWYSSHIHLHNKLLEASRQRALQQKIVIHVNPSQTLEYTDDGLSSIEPDIFYVPELTNQVALDLFILLNGLLFLFQFTIAGTHDIKPGLVDFLATCQDIPPMDKWRFVFILSPNSTVICPQPWRLELRTLQLYSAVIAL